ncbi:MAG TPA: hypothetical protein VF653_18475, partial [Methylomirabilota bacterium]
MPLSLTVLLLLFTLPPPARAGHELPFYPGYYPQEIRLETLTPAAAATQLRNGTLHAYVGADPFAGARLPVNVSAVESLQGYLVATPGAERSDAASRCAAAQRAGKRLGGSRGGFVAYPYPVTPYHADYLQHFDRVQAAKKALEAVPTGAPPRLSARGVMAERLMTQSRSTAEPRGPATTIEEIELRSLLDGQGIGAGEAPGPPWLKEGWFHAYLLLAPSMSDPAARQAADALYRRLTTGAYDGPAERADLERQLVGRLAAGCERVVLGYIARREPFSSEFSQGVENIAWDSQSGF